MRLTDARLRVNAAFALAFADGSFAVGRPVSEAFVIARPHRSLGGKPVYLEPIERSETARSGGLGPALDRQLSAHSFRTLVYQVPDAPSGYDLGAGNIAIKPPYRAGYKLVIGSDYHLLVIGKLLDSEGQPVKLLAGKATDLGNTKRPAMTVFTSRKNSNGNGPSTGIDNATASGLTLNMAIPKIVSIVTAAPATMDQANWHMTGIGEVWTGCGRVDTQHIDIVFYRKGNAGQRQRLAAEGKL